MVPVAGTRTINLASNYSTNPESSKNSAYFLQKSRQSMELLLQTMSNKAIEVTLED
jgi:hypothetical protein